MKNRKSLRLKNYDYSRCGLYFITICTHHRVKSFGEILDNQFMPNCAGMMIKNRWCDMVDRFDGLILDEYVVMPNHFHAILKIESKMVLGDIVGAFKSITTNDYIKGVHDDDWLGFEKKLWQRNYYEHIIRDEKSYLTLSQYIQNNPLKWQEDRFFENG
jgi:REP element-mobilizing transposase RayT